jgi:hypothetical protein
MSAPWSCRAVHTTATVASNAATEGASFVRPSIANASVAGALAGTAGCDPAGPRHDDAHTTAKANVIRAARLDMFLVSVSPRARNWLFRNPRAMP